jgi:hypothetical protein
MVHGPVRLFFKAVRPTPYKRCLVISRYAVGRIRPKRRIRQVGRDQRAELGQPVQACAHTKAMPAWTPSGRQVDGRGLVHVWSTRHWSRAVRNGLQRSPAVGRSRRLQARSCGNRPEGRTLIRMRALVQVQPGPQHWVDLRKRSSVTSESRSLLRVARAQRSWNASLPVCSNDGHGLLERYGRTLPALRPCTGRSPGSGPAAR